MDKKILAIAAALSVATVAGVAVYRTQNTSHSPATSSDSSAAKTGQSDEILATYGTQKLTRADIDTRLDLFAQMSPGSKKINFDELPDAVKENLVRGTVTENLLLDEANKQNLANDAEVQKKIELFKQQVIQQEVVERAVKAALTEDRKKARYDQMVKDWGDKEELKASHILVDSQEKADKIVLAIKSGQAFADVAKRESSDSSNKDKGGELGYFSRGQMVKTFEDAAFNLKIGEISAPVKTDFGWHVIRVDDRRKVSVPTYDSVQARLEAEIRQEVSVSYIDELLKKNQFESKLAKSNSSQNAPSGESTAKQNQSEKPAEKEASSNAPTENK
jgi:peptidyl-prolyl cis-trans isomerase C